MLHIKDYKNIIMINNDIKEIIIDELNYPLDNVNPSVNKIFVGHTTNMVQRKHVLKKQTELRYSEIFDVINKNGGWKCWRIKEIEKYNDCKTHADVLMREKYHYDILENLILSGHNLSDVSFIQLSSIINSINLEIKKLDISNNS